MVLLVRRLPYRIGEHQASGKGAEVETLAERAHAVPIGILPLRQLRQRRRQFVGGQHRRTEAPGGAPSVCKAYVVKPFSPTELVARVQTVLRRRAASELSEPPEPYRRGELTIDYARVA